MVMTFVTTAQLGFSLQSVTVFFLLGHDNLTLACL